ncbi:MAG TPA: hypothetical protein VKE22_28920 [Haliangiales bacterium]|nr:hypothetical protein [Haliangiales bacterium]
MRPGLPLVLVSAWLAGPSAARATDGESALSVTAGFGSFTVSQRADVSGAGGVLSLDYTYGIADSFWLRAAVGGGLYSASDQLTTGGSAAIGLHYAVDVLRYVPYVTGSVGVFYAGGGAVDAKAHLVLEVGAGVEIGEGRSFSWGIDARLASFASGATTFMIGPRISFKFGYF